jgi:UDP-glucuronate decarboxylase
VFQPLPVDDPTRRCPGIAKARRLLDWTPCTSLEDGLARTLEAFAAELRPGDPIRLTVARPADASVSLTG